MPQGYLNSQQNPQKKVHHQQQIITEVAVTATRVAAAVFLEVCMTRLTH